MPGSEEGRSFDVLAELIEAYKACVHAIGLPDPVKAVRVRLEEFSMSQADLGRCRAITEEQAHVLHLELGIPAEVLIQPYDLEHAA